MAAASLSSLKPLLRWRQGELIGAGAFGCVYMGMNLDSGELLAVKQVLIPSSSCQKAQAHVKELEEEVKLLQSLSHPNIVRYLGTARDNNDLNIFLEFVPGGSIASLLNKFGPFPEMVIKMYTRQILQGLDYLHKNGIMHRDIKGANILVDNKGQIKLADFGASKQVAELVTTMVSKSIKGTPYWMAPEVIRQTGHTLSADIWSVACTVIEMATGKAPWSDQFQEVSALFHIGTTRSHPPIPEHLSHAAQDFLLKCLQQEPQLRPTASELLEHTFVEVEGSSKVVRPIQPSGVVDRCKRRQLTTQRVENPCFSNCLDHSAKDRTSLELFTPDRNHVKASIKTVLNCSTRFDHNNVMTQTSNPTMESLTLKTMENQPDLDDVLCNLASPEIIQNRKNSNSPRAMENSFEDGSPSVCSFNCIVDDNNEEDDDVTEAKIKAFLEEKALELKKLQSPLYEGFNSSWNVERNLEVSSITSCEEQIRDAIMPQCWLSRSSSQSGISTARSSRGDSSSISSGTYAHGSHRTDLSLCSDSATQHDDLKEHSLSQLQHSSSYSPSVVSSADQLKLWKEELQQELQMRREEKKMLSRLTASTNLSQGTTRSLKRKQV